MQLCIISKAALWSSRNLIIHDHSLSQNIIFVANKIIYICTFLSQFWVMRMKQKLWEPADQTCFYSKLLEIRHYDPARTLMASDQCWTRYGAHKRSVFLGVQIFQPKLSEDLIFLGFIGIFPDFVDFCESPFFSDYVGVFVHFLETKYLLVGNNYWMVQ